MKEARNELLQFIAGLAMLIAGLLFFSQRVQVSMGFGITLGGRNIPSGLLIVPLIIGIVWLFASGGAFGSKVLIAIGVFIIVAGVISATEFHLRTISLFEWVVILVLIFGGAGLLAKVMFANPDEDYGYHSRRRNRKNLHMKEIDDALDDIKRNE